ncbi:hypothetical protein DL770_004492 [Monosporascus sp. CRB-9-2]|nr:hypothetical protein DL770_004492 [Monosporascus sp. CRB-9-2]
MRGHARRPSRQSNWSKNCDSIRESIIRKAAQQSTDTDMLSVSASADFVCDKWRNLTDRVKEAFSESNMPDYHDIHLLDSMLKRRRVLTETGRTLSTLKDTVLRSCHGDATAEVEKLEDQMKAWITDMDGMLSTMSSYLALDGARRGQKLTGLAFVFIPATTVATMFGMNVDVLSGNPPISWFVATAAATTIVTFAYAACDAMTARCNHVSLGSKRRGPLLRQSSFKDGVLYMVRALWSPVEQQRWETYREKSQEPSGQAGAGGPPVQQQNSETRYAHEEKSWLKKHYGDEFHFLKTHELNIYNDEDRNSSRPGRANCRL